MIWFLPNRNGRELRYCNTKVHMFSVVKFVNVLEFRIHLQAKCRIVHMWKFLCDQMVMTRFFCCCKLGVMIEITKFYILYTSVNDLDLHSRSKGNNKLRTFVMIQLCKVAWNSPNSHSDWSCKEDDCKEILQVWLIGLFYRLLLFFWRFCFLPSVGVS